MVTKKLDMAVILVLMSTASLQIFQNIPKLLVPKLAILLVKICTTNLHSFQYIKKLLPKKWQ